MGQEMILCDTDVFIDYWNTKNKRHESTKASLEKDIGLDNIVLSVITQMELMMGTDNKQEERVVKEKLSRFNLILTDKHIAMKALELFEQYRLSHDLKIPDCFIAATAIITGLELFT